MRRDAVTQSNTLNCHLARRASDCGDAVSIQVSNSVTWRQVSIQRTGATQVTAGVVTPPAVFRRRRAAVDALTIGDVELTRACSVSQGHVTRCRDTGVYISQIHRHRFIYDGSGKEDKAMLTVARRRNVRVLDLRSVGLGRGFDRGLPRYRMHPWTSHSNIRACVIKLC